MITHKQCDSHPTETKHQHRPSQNRRHAASYLSSFGNVPQTQISGSRPKMPPTAQIGAQNKYARVAYEKTRIYSPFPRLTAPFRKSKPLSRPFISTPMTIKKLSPSDSGSPSCFASDIEQCHSLFQTHPFTSSDNVDSMRVISEESYLQKDVGVSTTGPSFSYLDAPETLAHPHGLPKLQQARRKSSGRTARSSERSSPHSHDCGRISQADRLVPGLTWGTIQFQLEPSSHMEPSCRIPSDVFSEVDTDFLSINTKTALGAGRSSPFWSSDSSVSSIPSSDSFVDTARSIKSWPMPPINNSPSKSSYRSEAGLSTRPKQSTSVHCYDALLHGTSSSMSLSPVELSVYSNVRIRHSPSYVRREEKVQQSLHSFLPSNHDSQLTLVTPSVEHVRLYHLDDVNHGVRVTVSRGQSWETIRLRPVLFRSGHPVVLLRSLSDTLWLDMDSETTGISSLLYYLRDNSDVVVEYRPKIMVDSPTQIAKCPSLRIRVFASTVKHGRAFIRLNFAGQLRTDVGRKQAILVCDCNAETPATYRDIRKKILEFWDDYDRM